MANSTLSNAKAAKKDEFYTMFYDIETEMEAYLDYNPDVFRGKTILLPCDDPEWSNFTRYFAQNFEELGLKKLISTSYAIESKAYKTGIQLSFLETESPKFDKGKTNTHGKIFVLEHDTTGDGRINLDDLEWDYLEGDGDFRSDEVKKLRDEADIIVTNPPFSLFREFMAWILEADKKFIILGNINSISYKEVFPRMKDNQVWNGVTNFNKGMYFRVPEDFEYAPTYKFEREMDGMKVNRVPGICWYTNIEHGRRHRPLCLMTEADNIKYSKHKEMKGVGYKHYDNFDAIEVNYFDAIPTDYDGMMGVSLTYMDKYCPEQFEIVGITQSWFKMASKIYPKQIQVSKTGKQTVVTKLNDGAAIEVEGPLDGEVYYIVDGKYYSKAYARILIRKKQA